MMIKKLNVGCGRDIKKGYINIDLKKEKGVDMVCDISKCKLPFKDNSIDEIYASHVIEHIYDFKKVMTELHRILKAGGILKIRVPHFSYSGAYHPHHRIFFNSNSFVYMCKGFLHNVYEYDQIFSGLNKVRINFLKGWHLENYLVEKIINISGFTRSVYEDTFLRSLFPAQEVEVELVK